MGLSADDMSALSGLGDAATDVAALAAAARARWNGLRVTVVDAVDVRGETPVLETASARVFLLGSDGHCWSMTSDPAAASGLMLAARC